MSCLYLPSTALPAPVILYRPSRLYLLRGALFLGAADELLILPAVGLVRRLWGARLALVLWLVLQIGTVPHRLGVPARQLRPETAPRRGDAGDAGRRRETGGQVSEGDMLSGAVGGY